MGGWELVSVSGDACDGATLRLRRRLDARAGAGARVSDGPQHRVVAFVTSSGYTGA